MFWRLGSVLDSRPVAVAAWLKVVCRRPVLFGDQLGQRVEVGALELRELAPALDLLDDLVLRRGSRAARGRRSRSRSCRAACATAPASRTARWLSCCGEPIVNSSPASSQISLLELLDATPTTLGRDLAQAVGVELDARPLHAAQHLDQRQLDLARSRRSSPAARRCAGPGGRPARAPVAPRSPLRQRP